MTFQWDKQAVARLISMAKREHNYRQIAEELGTTRNAVIGKIDRLRKHGVDIPKLVVAKTIRDHSKPRPASKPRQRPKAHAPFATVEPCIKIEPVSTANIGDEFSLHIPFSEIRHGQCQWPDDLKSTKPATSQMTCCGNPVVDRCVAGGNRFRTHCSTHLLAGTQRDLTIQQRAQKKMRDRQKRLATRRLEAAQ